jgi:hypothetical protein
VEVTPVRLGMTIAEARAALSVAGVPFDERPETSELAFRAGGKRFEVYFKDGVAHWLGTPEEPTSPDDAVPLIEAQIAFRGAPSSMSHQYEPRIDSEAVRWRWPELSIHVARARDKPWRAGYGGSDPARHAPAHTADELRALIAQVRAHLDDVRRGEGARADAVAAWRDVLERRTRSLADALRVFAATAPASPIHVAGVHHLASRAARLARHHELARDPDDDRAAIVVIDERARPLDARHGYVGAVLRDSRVLAWRCELAREVGTQRAVLLLGGSCAYGISRIFDLGDELYPDPGESQNVTITGRPSPTNPSWRLVRASIGAVTVEVEGSPTAAGRIAARLALARAKPAR